MEMNLMEDQTMQCSQSSNLRYHSGAYDRRKGHSLALEEQQPLQKNQLLFGRYKLKHTEREVFFVQSMLHAIDIQDAVHVSLKPRLRTL
jgi:hypothetical protein